MTCMVKLRKSSVSFVRGSYSCSIASFFPSLLYIIVTKTGYWVSIHSTAHRRESQRAGQCFNTCMCSTSVNTLKSFKSLYTKYPQRSLHLQTPSSYPPPRTGFQSDWCIQSWIHLATSLGHGRSQRSFASRFRSLLSPITMENVPVFHRSTTGYVASVARQLFVICYLETLLSLSRWHGRLRTLRGYARPQTVQRVTLPLWRMRTTLGKTTSLARFRFELICVMG